jgi:phosphoglycolate phosphatase
MVLRLVLFDCDGTLVDSQRMIIMTMARAFERAGLPPPTDDATRAIIGLSLPEAVAKLTDHQPDAPIDRLAAGYRAAYEELSPRLNETAPLYPGIRDLLEKLAAADDTLVGVVTGKGRRGLDAVLAAHGIADLFTVLRTGDDGPSKPHPFMVEDAVAAVGADMARTIVIGDTTYDIDMAKAAGARAIAVAWGYHGENDLMASAPDAYVETSHQLSGMIDRLVAVEN